MSMFKESRNKLPAIKQLCLKTFWTPVYIHTWIMLEFCHQQMDFYALLWSF